jgi:WS/DGAT/MGAT family acyltransferase
MSGVDTAWLRMEQPTNLMMIVGIWMFDERLDPKALKRALGNRFLAFHRFRQRAVQDSTGAWWEDDESFDIDSHVHLTALPGKADKAELQALVSDLASTPLDFSKPLWQYHLVDNYRGGSALIMRIHHCYADGIALTEVVLSMTHETAAGSLALEPRKVETSAGGEADFWEQILRPVAGAFENATRMGKNLFEQGRELAANPQLASGAIEEVTKKGMEIAGEIAKLALMGRDAHTRFKGPLGVRKIAAWAEPFPLEEVKVMGKALGCSINDVLLAMAAGALRSYLAQAGDAVDGLEIRAIVPVNLRPAGAARSLGNQFGLVFLDLPVGVDNPLERLFEVRQRMLALKGSYQPVIALGLLHTVGFGPKILQEQVTSLLSQNASAVMTNVPGPQHPLYFAGKRIAELNFWVPQSGGIGMGVSILSYDGRIQFGLITDAGLVPDPDRIVARFHDEFDKLMWLTLMSPWGEEPGGTARAAENAESPPAARKKRVPARTRGTPAAGAHGASGTPRPRTPKRFRNP